jgi:hypothetical protein
MFSSYSNDSFIKMKLTTIPDSLPHGSRLVVLCEPRWCGEWWNHWSHGDGWCDVGLFLMVCLSVLHVCNLKASRNHLLSYPYEWGITRWTETRTTPNLGWMFCITFIIGRIEELLQPPSIMKPNFRKFLSGIIAWCPTTRTELKIPSNSD